MVKKEKSLFDQYKYAVLIGAGSFVVALILIFIIGSPLWKDFKESSRVLKEKRAVLLKLEEKLENLKSLKSQEEELKQKNIKVKAALPTDKDISRLFIQFENIATQNGLSIDSVTEQGAVGAVAESTSEDNVRAVSYNVTGNTNDYNSLKNALVNLEKALRILNISKVDTSSSGDNLSVILTVSSYVRSDK